MSGRDCAAPATAHVVTTVMGVSIAFRDADGDTAELWGITCDPEVRVAKTLSTRDSALNLVLSSANPVITI